MAVRVPPLLLLVGLLPLLSFATINFEEKCLKHMRAGRATVEGMAEKLVHEERLEMIRRHRIVLQKLHGQRRFREPSGILVKDDNDVCNNPPNATIFTLAAQTTTTVPTTTTTTTAGPSVTGEEVTGGDTSGTDGGGTDGGATDGGNTGNPGTSSAAPSGGPAEDKDTADYEDESVFREFRVPALFDGFSDEKDPYARWMMRLHKYLSSENEQKVCGTRFNMKTLSEEQLYGGIAILASTTPGPFCNLCDRLLNQVEHYILRPYLGMPEESEAFLKLLMAQMPSVKGVCSMLAPACYETRATNNDTVEGERCLECSVCMMLTNYLQHRFFFDKAAVDRAYTELAGDVFHSICVGICNWAHTNGSEDNQHCIGDDGVDYCIIPPGTTYASCMTYTKKLYYDIIDIAKVVLIPERFCGLELGWCEQNETPNALHCLRELCLGLKTGGQGDSLIDWICGLIPDEPKKADLYLNVAQTKIYKPPRPESERLVTKPTRWRIEL